MTLAQNVMLRCQLQANVMLKRILGTRLAIRYRRPTHNESTFESPSQGARLRVPGTQADAEC
jgi:hypothetical protein